MFHLVTYLGRVDLLQHAAVAEHQVLGRLGVGHATEGDVAVRDHVAGCERLLGPGLDEVPDLVCGPVPDTDIVSGVQEVLHHYMVCRAAIQMRKPVPTKLYQNQGQVLHN